MGKARLLAIGLAVSLGGSSAQADPPSFRNHAAPFSFRFGNEIDARQESVQARDGSLHGFLYIAFTGEWTPSGYPVAHPCDGQTPSRLCVAGWALRGHPGTAAFLYLEKDHPTWLASRADIPQPGAFTHFHWIASASSDRRRVTDPRCDAQLESELLPGAVCPGFFIELVALTSFAFQHQGQLIRVDPGTDVATHLNVVTSVPALR